MSGDKRRSYGVYSIFVSGLHRETTKLELNELFKHCGPIASTFVADYQGGPYIFGFVRFTDPQAALTAVREVDQWSLKGRKLSVELAIETRDKLVTEGHLEHVPKQGVKHALPARQVETRMSMDNLLSESRLRDCCTEINLQQGHRLDAEKLMADINKLKCRKTCVVQGDLIGQRPKTISHIKKKLLKSEENGRVPAQTTNTFFKTLQNILENVASIAQGDDDQQSPSAPDLGVSEGASSQLRGGIQRTFVEHLTHAIQKTKQVSSGDKMACPSDLNKSQPNVCCSERTCVSSGEDERRDNGQETATKLEKRTFSDQNEGGEIVAGDFEQSHVKQKPAVVLSESEGFTRNGVPSVRRNPSKIHIQSLIQDTRKNTVDETTKTGERNDTINNVVDDTRNSMISDKRICSTGRGVLDTEMIGHMSDPEESTNGKHCSLRDIMTGSSNEDSSSCSDNSDSDNSERNRLFLKILGLSRDHCVDANTSSSNQDTSENESSTSEVETTNHNICAEQGNPSEMKLNSDNCEKLMLKDRCEELTSMVKKMLHIPTNDGNQTRAVVDTHVSDFHVDQQLDQASCRLPADHQSHAPFKNSPMAMDKLTNTSSSTPPNHSLAKPHVTNGYLPPMGRGLSSILDKLRSKERKPGACLSGNDKHAHKDSADVSRSGHSHVDCAHDDCGGDDSQKQVYTSNSVAFSEDKTCHGPIRQRNARPKARQQSCLGSSIQSQSLSEAELRFKPREEHNETPHHSISRHLRIQSKPYDSSSVLSSRCPAVNHTVAKSMSIHQGHSKSASSESESDVVAVDSGVESDSYQRKSQAKEKARSAAMGVDHRSKDSDQLQQYIKQVIGRGRGLQAKFQ